MIVGLSVCPSGRPSVHWGIHSSGWVSVCPSGCPFTPQGISLGQRLLHPQPGRGGLGATMVARGRWDGSVTTVPLPVPRPSSSGVGPGAMCWSAAGRRSWPRPSGTASGAARLAWRSWRMARSHPRCSRCAGAPTSPLGGEGGPRVPGGRLCDTPCLFTRQVLGPKPTLQEGSPEEDIVADRRNAGAAILYKARSPRDTTVAPGLGIAECHHGGPGHGQGTPWWALGLGMAGRCCGSPSGGHGAGHGWGHCGGPGDGRGQGTPWWP